MLRLLKPSLILWLTLYLAIVLWTQLAWGATYLDQSTVNAEGATADHCTIAEAPNADGATVEIVIIDFFDTTTSVNAAPQGFALVDSHTTPNTRSFVWATTSSQLGENTFGFNASVNFVCTAWWASGTDTIAPIDAHAPATITTTPYDTASITTHYDNELLLGYWFEQSQLLYVNGTMTQQFTWNRSANPAFGVYGGTEIQATAGGVSKQITRDDAWYESEGTAWLIALANPRPPSVPLGCQQVLRWCEAIPSALPRNETNYTYRDQTACITTGTIDASGSATVTVSWPVPSQVVALGTGNSYYVDCHAENQQPTPAAGVTVFVGPEVAVLEKTATGVTVRVANHDGAASRTAEVCCRGYRFGETNE